MVARTLQRACEAGNTSLYVNGIDPGFSGDTLVHAAVSLATRVSSITVQEIFDYGNYDDAEFTGAAMGFGTAPDDDSPMMFLPGVIVAMWGGQVRSLADHLASSSTTCASASSAGSPRSASTAP